MGEVSRRLAQRIEDLALELLGTPTLKKRRYWRWGARGSLSVTIAGTKRGLWYSFEEGRGGDALDLVARCQRMTPIEAWEWGERWLV